MMKTNQKKRGFTVSSLQKMILVLVISNILSLAVIVYNNSHSSQAATPRILQQSSYSTGSLTLRKHLERLDESDEYDEDSDFEIYYSDTDDELEAQGIWDKRRANMPTFHSYRFDNPMLAYKILSQLDIFEPVNDSVFGAVKEGANKYHVPWFGMINDDNYCNKHRAYFVENPENLFEEMNFITTAPPSSLMRGKVLAAMGNDIMPHIGSHMRKNEKENFLFEVRPDAHILFSSSSSGLYKHIGKHLACLTQAVSNIPGHSSFSRKDIAAESAINYAKNFQDRPQCFNHDKFFPETWLLYNKEACQEFFNKFNSEEYLKQKAEKKIVYIRKVGSGAHRGAGVFPVTDEEETFLRETYQNGSLCGKINSNFLVQHYIHNPLLLEGRKFDFRMYMLVASTNPLMVFYHDGFLRVSLGNYDNNSTDKKVLLTNLALNKQIYQEVKDGNLFNGMDEEQLKVAQQWSFERLQAYLLKTGVITDPNWLDNYLRPEFKKAMIHLIRMASYNFLKRSSLYELYGVDFLLDQNLNLWFIEANSGPALGGYSQPMEKFIAKMIGDHFQVVMGLIRSRAKRVVNYVNKVIESDLAVEGKDDKVFIKDLKQRIAEFKTVSRNYFEKEFEPSADNGFQKIVDDNLYGTSRYQGLIDEDCIKLN